MNRLKALLLLSLMVVWMSMACRSISGLSTLTHFNVPKEQTILESVLKQMNDCRTDAGIQMDGNVIQFSCYLSADSRYHVSITRLDSEASAQAQFELARLESPRLCFHGYDQFRTENTNEYNQYVVQEEFIWHAGSWLITTRAVYDYGYYHYQADDFSEAIYAAAVEEKLFPPGSCP